MVSHLPRNQLHEVRTVNSAFAAACIPSLFHTIPCWLGLYNLENLSTICQHPILSRQVKQLVFSNISFKYHGNDGDTADVAIRDHLKNQKPPWNDDEIPAKYRAMHKDCLSDQTALHYHGADITMLSKIFVGLPALQEVVIGWYTLNADLDGLSWQQESRIEFEGLHGSAVILDALQVSRKPLHRVYFASYRESVRFRPESLKQFPYEGAYPQKDLAPA